MSVLFKSNNIKFSYNNEPNYLLNNINLTVNNGDRICIRGENGCGKSTLLKILCGLINIPTNFIFNGEKIKDLRIFKKRIAYIPDTPLLYDYLSAKDNIEFIMNLWGIKNKQLYKNNVLNIAQQLNFDIYSNQIVSNYSLGMKHKLFLISMLARDTDLIFLDEPLSALDQESQTIATDMLINYSKSNKAIVFVSHINNLQIELANKIYTLNKGTLREDFINEKIS